MVPYTHYGPYFFFFPSFLCDFFTASPSVYQHLAIHSLVHFSFFVTVYSNTFFLYHRLDCLSAFPSYFPERAPVYNYFLHYKFNTFQVLFCAVLLINHFNTDFLSAFYLCLLTFLC
jgi:hypothetical protein